MAHRHLGVLTVIVCYSHLWLWGLHQQSDEVPIAIASLCRGWTFGCPLDGRATRGPSADALFIRAPSALASMVCVRLTQSSHLHVHTPHIRIPACLDIGGFNSVLFKRSLFVAGGQFNGA